MSAPTLWSIANEFAALEELLEAGGHTEEDHVVVARWLEELDGALEHKMQRCIAYVRNEELFIDAADVEAKRLNGIKKVHENRVKRTKEAIKFLFEAQKLKRIETPIGSVTLAKNGGKEALEVNGDVDSIPAEFVKTVTTKVVDTEAIRARLDAGEQLPFARLVPRGSHIKVA